jgi:GNAT superfamily N-acetyltransferase
MLRAATTADLPALSANTRLVSERSYGSLMTAAELAWWLEVVCSQEHFAALLDDPDCAVLIDDELRAVGTARFAEAVYIGDLYVARPGAGAGRSIVGVLLDRARDAGLPSAECSVMAWNVDAAAFWERIGFRRGRFMTQPAWDPEDLMRRVGWMRSSTLSTAYLAYVKPL